jgi:hypothetical protein
MQASLPSSAAWLPMVFSILKIDKLDDFDKVRGMEYL